MKEQWKEEAMRKLESVADVVALRNPEWKKNTEDMWLEFVDRTRSEAVAHFKQELLEKVEKMNIGRDEQAGRERNNVKFYHDGYNEAIADIAALLQTNNE